MTNRLFVISLNMVTNILQEPFCFDHYMLLVEIKGFNSLIDNKPFFANLYKMSRKNFLNCQKTITLLKEIY